ncbi:hypothetical protein HSX11_00320 [Oxalobacteraceae bacterium]|nr:hypothetical protein [Oxalobacteraceae bacterium]
MSPRPEISRAVMLDDASAGMVLALDLLDGHGNVLLPEGATLSEASLNSLRRRGIVHCMVRVDAPEAAATPPDPQRQARISARLAQLFRHHGAAGAGADLLRMLTDYRLRD